jgi:hypothetical protein
MPNNYFSSAPAPITTPAPTGVTPNPATDQVELLQNILVELKRANRLLEILTGEQVCAEDVTDL